MSKVGIFMANGCEEIEGLTVVDILRRAGIEVQMIAIEEFLVVTGSHGITFSADVYKENAKFEEYDGIVLPGGMPGTKHLGADATVRRVIKEMNEEKKLVAAICAAPSVLGENHILEGKRATSYPGFEDKLLGAFCLPDAVVHDGNVITSRGMGTAIPFALAIVAYFNGNAAAEELSKSIIFS